MSKPTHGHTIGNFSSTYITWLSMRGRCNNPTSVAYSRYGGRGIKVCDRWNTSFDLFLADMGLRPKGHTIDRIDNDGNYEPGNCKWSTRSEQNKKRSRQAYSAQLSKTHCPSGHAYNKENTHLTKNGYRKCRECGRLRSQTNRNNNKKAM